MKPTLDRLGHLIAGTAIVAVTVMPTTVAAQEPPTLGHVGTFFVADNLAEDEDPLTPTSAEIVDITADGATLVYTDAYTSRLGFVDVTDPSAPVALGGLDLDGAPTSVAVVGDLALAAVVTSEDPDGETGPLTDKDAPTGALLVIDLETREVLRTIELAGQPDSVAVAPSGRYAAIVIENERDEEENEGLIPQAPSGSLQVLDLTGEIDAWTLRTVDLAGLAETAPEDAEPEFVDINDADLAVVSLQENNHLAIVDLADGTVTAHFSAGSVDLSGIDTVEEAIGPQGSGVIDLSGSREAVRREPDAVAWIDADSFATANEGDYADADGIEGGSRGFTIFNVDGSVEYDSAAELEHEIVRIGHYPEGRSENKGGEPEGLEVGTIDGRTLLFVAAERADIVAVYDVTDGQPELAQVLPTGIGPEGLKLTSGGLLAVTSEVDGAADEFAVRPMITLFSTATTTDWTYPQLVSSDDEAGLPIPWVAMSGLSGDPADPAVLWAVSDSVLGQAFLYRIDVSATPAVITERIPVGASDVDVQTTGDYDLEGIAARPEGGFWLASEGRIDEGSSRPNLVIRVDADGAVLASVALPEALVAGATSSGLEGVAVTGTEAGGDEVIWVALQREWADDAKGFVKLGRYDVAGDAWTFAAYPLDAVESPGGGWVGLSEITALPDGTLVIVERDNQLGQEARIKRVYGIDPASVTWSPFGSELTVLGKTLLRDVIGDLDAASISIPDKLEGLGVSSDGDVFLVTDNDGVDENYGETLFLRLGSTEEAFAG